MFCVRVRVGFNASSEHTHKIFVKIRRLPAHLQKYLRLVNHVNDCCIPNASEHYLIEHTKVCIQCTCHSPANHYDFGVMITIF